MDARAVRLGRGTLHPHAPSLVPWARCALGRPLAWGGPLSSHGGPSPGGDRLSRLCSSYPVWPGARRGVHAVAGQTEGA